MTVATISPFTIETYPNDRTTPTHVAHLAVPAAQLEWAVASLLDVADSPTHTGWLTGQVIGGDSWAEWCGPATAEDDYVALHVTIVARPGACPWRTARVIASVVAPCNPRTLNTLHVTVGDDWSESA